MQAAGSWSHATCCAVPGNICRSDCYDQSSSSDWLFGLWPGPPKRFEHQGDTDFQIVRPDRWPQWGGNGHCDGDLVIGETDGKPGGSHGWCPKGDVFKTTRDGQICGGWGNWGETNVEVWYPR